MKDAKKCKLWTISFRSSLGMYTYPLEKTLENFTGSKYSTLNLSPGCIHYAATGHVKLVHRREVCNLQLSVCGAKCSTDAWTKLEKQKYGGKCHFSQNFQYGKNANYAKKKKVQNFQVFQIMQLEYPPLAIAMYSYVNRFLVTLMIARYRHFVLFFIKHPLF